MFSGCTSLEGLEIYDNVFSLFGDTFSGCTGLEYVRFPSKESTVPMNSCSGCVKLKEVILPEGISAIGEGAFRGCAALRRADLPASLEYVYQNAFNGCAALRAVYYGGTRTDWAEVWVYEGNEPLQAAARYYADDAVTIETPDFTGGKVTVTVHCDAGVKARAVCAIFDADGKLLSVEAVELKQGQDNVLVFDGCDPSLTVTLLAIDADSAAPLCAAMKT